MAFIPDDDMISAFSSNTAVESFDISVLRKSGNVYNAMASTCTNICETLMKDIKEKIEVISEKTNTANELANTEAHHTN